MKGIIPLGNHDVYGELDRVWYESEEYKIFKPRMEKILVLLDRIHKCPIGNMIISDFHFVQEHHDIRPDQDTHFFTEARLKRLEQIARKLG